ncbi:Ribosomal protein L10P [Sesbania bispinosa]|nr:Ribosomal protein L10P [Sesbania bispinosa]
MGKNSLMKRSIIEDAHKIGNKTFLNLVPLLVGNVALIFTKGDLREVSERIAKYKVK